MTLVLQEHLSDQRTDHDLVAAVNACDSEAFEVLYHRHRDWVVNLAFRFTGDRALALDVLQDTFLYLLRKFPGFELTCQLRSFLYPAVGNLSIAAQRKAGRCQSDGTELDELAAPLPPLAENSGSGLDDLNVALASLAPAHREVLLLRFVDGLSLKEIAQALDLPLGTVKSRLHYALNSLRSDPRTRQWFER